MSRRPKQEVSAEDGMTGDTGTWVRLPVAAAIVAIVLALLPLPAGAGQTAPTRPTRSEATDNDPPEIDPAILRERYGPLRFVVDPAVVPGTSTIDPVDGTRDVRQIAAIAFPGGATSEFVLDHVILHAHSSAERDAFVSRWGATVLESDRADSQGQLHMVKVNPEAADVTALPGNLLAVEPEHAGEHRVGSDRALKLLALVAQEASAGMTVTVSWLAQSDTITDGQLYESPDFPEDEIENVFGWPYMSTGGFLDTGVTRAWQLLEAAGKLDAKVRLLVNDGGFVPNPDFPDSWTFSYFHTDELNTKKCGDNECPYHGTSVVAAAMGRAGNGWGTAGPAGVLASDLIAVDNDGDVWTQLRRTARKTEEYHPKVVNMSWSFRASAFKEAMEFAANRHFRHMNEAGALLVASAGNQGVNVDDDTLHLPCESSRVMCVGGTHGKWTLGRDPGSNYGTGYDSRSVEMYAPFCVWDYAFAGSPEATGISKSCGTSVSAPFVAGVAALVIAADPSLTHQQVRELLIATAHTGLYGDTLASGVDRWVDAAKAVATALKVSPSVQITAPADKSQHSVNSSFGFAAKVVDYHGDPLQVQWASSIDGKLSTPTSGVLAWPSLSAGKHKITATAVDVLGNSTTDHIAINVVDEKAGVWIVSPPKGETFYAGKAIDLTGLSIDPDTGSPVPDNQAAWVVRSGGKVVHAATGHKASLPAAKAVAGQHVVEFSADGTTVSRALSILSAPLEGTLPTATITSPQQDITLESMQGGPVHVLLSGTGADKEDGALSGTRFQWIATDQFGTTTLLCTGSSVPGNGAKDKLGTLKNCASIDAELPWNQKASTEMLWSVSLKVYDAAGNPGHDAVTVSVILRVL